MTDQQSAYLTDPFTLEFEANIIRKTKIDAGRFDVILEQTYFYPTGGGQEHDTGLIGPARVIDVFKDEAGNVVHRLDRAVTETRLPAKIDAGRRLAGPYAPPLGPAHPLPRFPRRYAKTRI